MDPNAVQDILLNPRYEGMMSTISGVTDVVDGAFMTVITFVAFFIISVALLRNVLAGAYCAFPKFWDQVAHAHEENENTAFFEQIKGIKDSYKTASMGSIKTFFFRIVPNIKCLTDFEDDTLSAKSYFIKAIPQMIGVVIIGVFIYNGYYRDFTAVIANTGSELIERTVLSFDPVGAFDTIMNTAGKPTFATDGLIDAFSKNKNRVANDIYSAIIAKYTDIKDANSKSELAKDIDEAVEAMFPEDTKSWFGAENGEYDIQTRISMVKPFDATNRGSGETTDDVFTRTWCIGIGKEGAAPASSGSNGSAFSSQITFDSTVDAINQEWSLGVAVQATRHAVKVQTNGSAKADLSIPMDGGAIMVYSPGTGKTVDLYNGDAAIGSVSVEYDKTAKTAKFTVTGSDVPTNTKLTLKETISLRAIDTSGGSKPVDIVSITIGDSVIVATADGSGYDVTYSAGGMLTVTKKTTQSQAEQGSDNSDDDGDKKKHSAPNAQ